MSALTANVILEAIVGSTAYGLATPESDVDKLGVFILPTAEFSRLDMPKDTEFSRVAHEPDVTLHELGKFCRLALQCNPTILELLWVPDELVTTMSEEGRQLRARREWFATADLVCASYMGYATSQFKRLSERGDFASVPKNRIEKHARHLLRLMWQGYTFYSTGTLPIRVNDPAYFHQFGKQVVSEGPHVAEEELLEYSRKFENTTSKLPTEMPRDAVDLWLRSIRKKF